MNEKDEDVMRIIKKYKKRSRFGDILHRILKNKGATVGLVILCVMLVIFVISLFMSYNSITAYIAKDRYQAPSLKYPFGTDNMGRNLFLRVIYGTRYSIVIGFSVVSIALFIGITLGSTAGYYGGTLENLIMRFADVLSSIPGMLMSMVVVTVLGQSVPNLILAVSISSIPMFTRVTRASVLTVRNNEFVEAARAIGFSGIRIIFTQVLPNALSPVIVATSNSIGQAILTAAALSYLGFGVPVPMPEWGALISAGREQARNAPWLVLFPGLAIMLVVLGLNMLGDGLRDALDPKLKK
jgi:peptide/nickel transport system permease protein